MRLGGPLFSECNGPESWAEAVKAAGYRAAFCPVGPGTDEETARAYADAAHKADIVIAEVGAWSNPLSPDSETAAAALAQCKASLQAAEVTGAACCVNISGSCGLKWDGPDPANLTEETFDRIVEVVREIIDDVNPVRTYYTLETMPWMYPDSPDSYVRLLEAIDRRAFAVHLDPVNLVCSPQRYFSNKELIKECFKKLGPHIKSCHAKDILLHDNLTVHLDEVKPGCGNLDYSVFLTELNRINPDVPLMLEHLQEEKEYEEAAAYIRSVARKEDITL